MVMIDGDSELLGELEKRNMWSAQKHRRLVFWTPRTL